MEKENFRILLDLSDLQDRMHNFVWMLISTIDIKSIADLKNAIIYKLDLDTTKVIKLFLNGGLLLEEEKIFILRENDTVQIKYEKLPDSFCHNSTLMEVQDRNVSLIAEKRINQLEHNSSCMEVDDQMLALNAKKCNENKSSKHSKKHKRKVETSDLPLSEENKTLSQYEALPESASCNSSSVEVKSNKLSISAENCNGNKTSKHSKKHKRRNEGGDLSEIEENKDMRLNKKKRKRDVSSLDTFNQNETHDPISKYLFAENNDSSSKKNKSSCGSVTNEVIVSNENVSKVEISKVPVVSDASVSCKKPKDTVNLEAKEDSKPRDVSVDSFAHGSNCKKRKRRRNRKRKADANLLGPFMSANLSNFQNFTESDPKSLSPSDDCAGIRKHIRFTSPDCENIAKEMETVEPEMNPSSSQSESSPTTASIQISPKSPSLHENIARATEIANKSSSKIFTSPNGNCLPLSIKKPFLNQFTNQLETTKEISQSTSSKTYNVPGSTNLLSPKPTASISEEPVKYSDRSYWGYSILECVPPMGSHIAFKLLELGENYSPEVSHYKEGIIKSSNSHSDKLEIELINIEIKPGRTGKFENIKEDEDPQEEVIKKVMVPWSSLIEPRLIKLAVKHFF